MTPRRLHHGCLCGAPPRPFLPPRRRSCFSALSICQASGRSGGYCAKASSKARDAMGSRRRRSHLDTGRATTDQRQEVRHCVDASFRQTKRYCARAAAMTGPAAPIAFALLLWVVLHGCLAPSKSTLY